MNYIAVGNDELKEDLPALIKCPHCDNQHEVQHSKNDPRNKDCKINLSFYKCGEKSYLCGIDNKLLPPPKPKKIFQQRPLLEVVIDAWWGNGSGFPSDVAASARVLGSIFEWFEDYACIHDKYDELQLFFSVLSDEESKADEI
jgi:hypothetical protein